MAKKILNLKTQLCPHHSLCVDFPTLPSVQPHGGDPQALIQADAGAAPGGVPLSQRHPTKAGRAREDPQSFYP